MLQAGTQMTPWILNVLFAAGLTLTAGGLLGAAIMAWSEYRDRRVLRGIAVSVAGGLDDPGARLAALNAWVYRNQGFAPNRRHFGWARLGPTPMQVLRHGGDCANKSRLLSAMLETMGMKSSLAMLYPHPGAMPVHTVVLAELGGVKTLADPVFDITFPGPGSGYVAVQDLVRDPGYLSERLRTLRAERGPQDKIMLYREDNHRLDHVTTINWRASRLTRCLAVLVRAVGAEPRYVMRPMFLENPKRALTYAALAVSLVGALVTLAVSWVQGNLPS